MNPKESMLGIETKPNQRDKIEYILGNFMISFFFLIFFSVFSHTQYCHLV